MMFHYDNQVVLCLNRTRAWTHRGDERERFNSSSVLKTRSLPTFVLLIESVLRQIWEFSDPVVCENFSKAHWMNGRIQGRQAHQVPGKMTCHTYSELVGRRTRRRSICLQLLFVSPFLVLSVVTMWIQDWSCVSTSLRGDLRGTDELVMWVHQTQTLRPAAASVSLGTSGAPWRDPTRIKLSLSVNKARRTHNNNYSHDGLISTAAN